MTAPQRYLRRCNGQPADGIAITRDTVDTVLSLARLAAVEIRGDLDTGISVRIPAARAWTVEVGGTVDRTFTYTPIPQGDT